MNKIKLLIIPCEENDYHPHLIRSGLLAVYMIIILLVNIFYINSSFVKSYAAVDFTGLYKLHNQIRKDNGLKQFAINSLLINSATKKAEAMLASNCWSHYCPDGKSPWEFFDEAGYVYLYAGENLAEGFYDNNAVINAWMNSPTHKENMLNSQFSEIGIGFAYGDYQGIKNNTIIVVHFGSRFLESTNSFIPEDNSNLTKSESKLTIDKPINGSTLNIMDFEISGKAENIDTVNIESNGKNIGKVESSGGNYTFRSPRSFELEQEYVLQAIGLDNNGNDVKSNLISLQMDFTPPDLNIDNFTFQNNILSISNTQAEKIVLTYTNDGNKNFEYLGNNNWQITINYNEIKYQSNITILASDKAGNTKQIVIPVETFNYIGDSPKKLGTNNISINPRLQVNITFSIFLSALFGIDFYILNKTGNTGKVNKTSHLNFIIFIIVFVLSIMTSLGGNILNGLST